MTNSDYDITGLKKIMGLKQFVDEYGYNREALNELCSLFDLFIIHPDIEYKVSKMLMGNLRDNNKAMSILPLSYKLLLSPKKDKIGKNFDDNPLTKWGNNDFKMDYPSELAKLIAKHRDSTYLMNFNGPKRFIKIGECNMDMNKIKENAIHVFRYLCLLYDCGLDNIFRISIHLNKTQIQLPIYVNLNEIEKYTVISPQKLPKNADILTKKRKELKLKQKIKDNISIHVKNKLIISRLSQNISKVKYFLSQIQMETDEP